MPSIGMMTVQPDAERQRYRHGSRNIKPGVLPVYRMDSVLPFGRRNRPFGARYIHRFRSFGKRQIPFHHSVKSKVQSVRPFRQNKRGRFRSKFREKQLKIRFSTVRQGEEKFRLNHEVRGDEFRSASQQGNYDNIDLKTKFGYILLHSQGGRNKIRSIVRCVSCYSSSFTSVRPFREKKEGSCHAATMRGRGHYYYEGPWLIGSDVHIKTYIFKHF